MIQIDEAALREGLPLHEAHWQYYLIGPWNVFEFQPMG